MAVILIVEDDFFILQNLEWMIEELGHTALPASDLAGALSHLAAPGRIDLLFVDIRLNTLAFGGFDVAHQAIDLRPDLPVLYTSGSPLTDDMTERFVPGWQFLQKPYSAAHLEASVEELLR